MGESRLQSSPKPNVDTWGAFINGDFRPAASGKTFPTFNPGNGEIIAYLAETDEEDIEAAVRAALAAFPSWKRRTGAARAKLLIKLAQLVEANAAKLAELESLNAGKPIRDSKAIDAVTAVDAHHMVAKVMFTGSTVTGKRIAAEAANTLKPVGLELGGKSAVIVYEDAPIDQAAQIATMAIFSNQGQICTAGSRLFLHEEVHDKVLEKVVENAKRVKIGDQMDPSTTMGPLISVRQKERVRGYIESGKRDAKLAYSGE